MKKRTIAVMVALALGVSGVYVIAQSSGTNSPGDGPPPGGTGGPRGGGFRPPRPPLEMVLDANGDGIISADEIANAAAALKKLDKNNDGQLTPDEYRPRRGPGGRGGPGGPGGSGGPDGQDGFGGPGHRPPPGGPDGGFPPPPPQDPPQQQ